MKLCGCGCGEEVTKEGNRFIRYHHNRVQSAETRMKNKIANTGKNNPMYGVHNYGKNAPNYGKKHPGINKADKNPMWKGNDIKYEELHKWINRNKPKPKLCEICNENKVYDAACVTGIYNRDFENWKYLCRYCHMISDGRIDKRDKFGRFIK